MLDEPGPPLNANVTGRLPGSAPSSVYEVRKTSALGLWPSDFPSLTTSCRSTTRPACAVYASLRRLTVSVW
jgi:hypothetical protein